MSLSNASAEIVAAGLGGSMTGAVSLFVWWRQTRSPVRKRKVTNAWQKQAQELTDELRRQHTANETYLKQQLTQCQTTQMRERREAAQEIARLNKLLTQQG